jgi:Glycosyltransferase (GlcNAc)
LESLREKSPKPVLTAYLPAFDPDNDPASRVMAPTMLRVDKFNPEGIACIGSNYFGESEYAHPIPGSFYSAHFAFADGSFAVEVRHDPQYFFLGEEISIAVRAFTHGYDFYYPHRLVAWHYYGRVDRPKMWDDHTPDAKRNGAIEHDWCDLNDRCWQRHRHLFGVDGAKSAGIDFGAYGFGTCRSLAQYERFAGVSFAHRGVHQALLEGRRPPIHDALQASEEEWLASLRCSHEIRIAAPESELGDWTAAANGVLYFFDGDGAELHREALDATKLRTCIASGWFNLVCAFLIGLRQIPVRYAFELCDSAGQSMKRLEKQVDA